MNKGGDKIGNHAGTSSVPVNTIQCQTETSLKGMSVNGIRFSDKKSVPDKAETASGDEVGRFPFPQDFIDRFPQIPEIHGFIFAADRLNNIAEG